MARTGHHPRGRPGLPALEALSRRTVVLAALLVATAACAPPRPRVVTSERPIALAIVTWNMHVGAGDLRRLVADLADGRLTGKPPSDYVLLLQEAVGGGPSDPAVIARDRRLSIFYAPVRMRGTRVTGNAILSTLALADPRAIELPRQRERRGALAATISVAGHELFVANAHLENRVSLWRGLLFSDGPRGRQAQALIAALPPGPGIAGGDLNTWLGPQEPAWKAFAARFTDTPPGPWQPTVRDRLVLDHLFFDLPDGWQAERRVLPDAYGSDHRPVLGVVSASF